MYVLIVVATVAVHFAFTIYVVVGGFLALRWPHTIWLHLAAVVWAAGNAFLNIPCPLTDLERWARREGGMAPLPSAGFIDHYITGVFYPRDAATIAVFAAFFVVAGSWALFAHHRHAIRTQAGPPPG
ncbi:DUF2784 domain-containing protein [Tomitella biformata]|uniref:DUF2784 domain-containing protein n=1 Tax=Tomitella biformata TaxID=630403 RepID=UPI0004644776|nr:DUF2784 domain-containing protein [Tomitella biformata]